MRWNLLICPFLWRHFWNLTAWMWENMEFIYWSHTSAQLNALSSVIVGGDSCSSRHRCDRLLTHCLRPSCYCIIASAVAVATSRMNNGLFLLAVTASAHICDPGDFYCSGNYHRSWVFEYFECSYVCHKTLQVCVVEINIMNGFKDA